MNQLPTGWNLEPFSQVARYATGRTPARANDLYWKSDTDKVPWVAISDMEAYGKITETSECVSNAALSDVFKGRVVPAGTLLMSFKLTIGRVATLGVPACHNEAIISIYPRKGVDQRFLGYYLSQVDYSDHQDRQVKGNTLNQAKIDRIPILLPPTPEQKSIADTLDRCREAINTELLLEKTTRELKRATFNALFSHGLHGEKQKETKIGALPQNWDVVRLGSLGKIGNGSTPKRTIPTYWDGGVYPWLTSAKVYDREIKKADQFITETALKECHLPKIRPGAILMAITGQGKTLGHCAILDIEATVSQHVAYLQTNLEKANPRFIRGYLETKYEYLRQIALGNGSTKGALTCAFLRDLLIPLPSLMEQEEVVSIINAIDEKIALHKEKIALLNELFKSLLNKLMTGEIRVGELDLSVLETILLNEAQA